jgi:hypothetical protein
LCSVKGANKIFTAGYWKPYKRICCLKHGSGSIPLSLEDVLADCYHQRSGQVVLQSRERDYMSSNGNLIPRVRTDWSSVWWLLGSMRACTLIFWIVAYGT